MKKHIPAPFRGQTRLLTYCGERYEGRASPYDARNAVLLAAMGGLLRRFCPHCLAKALASAFRQMEYGEQGARMAQGRRPLEERRETARRAVRARWDRWRASRGLPAADAEPMRLGMASDTEEHQVGDGVRDAPAQASEADLMHMPD